ncbi:MAG: response regulator [Candidatus Syntrophosphaera sp.]
MPGKVLIVDEDALTRQTIGAWLENKGYVANYVSDADAAALRLGRDDYDHVIVDIQWPGQKGTQRIAQIRQLFPTASIIAMSTFADFELEQEARQQGAYTCMTKPLEKESLLSILDSTSQQDKEAPKEGFLPGRLIGQMLLRGFTPDQQWEFMMTGTLRTFTRGEAILPGEDASMVWVEKGRLEALYNDVPVESLGEGDFWGEETFVNPSAAFAHLVALEDSQLRLFRRKRTMEFFAYQEETLTKRYMINLIHCLHLKWKRSVARLVLAGERSPQQEE